MTALTSCRRCCRCSLRADERGCEVNGRAEALVIWSGEALPAEVGSNDSRRRGARGRGCINLYGPTETAVDCRVPGLQGDESWQRGAADRAADREHADLHAG